uniref:Uncharacterized protein n=1 Tax=Euplotes harpa TaxID=151035 RepID=A0A7S3JIG8_9SPIT|mmetsp:Transcript_3780/g.4619  ORF Transcript_3780/g.4619 Transcript_3780/m.4619 type:complete len:207 (+) Transcript_3780:1-621(+)
MKFCCCGWTLHTGCRAICIYDYIMTALTVLALLISFIGRNGGQIVGTFIYLLIVSVPRFVSAIFFMKNSYSYVWSRRVYWIRIVTVVIQGIFTLIRLIGAIFSMGGDRRRGMAEIFGFVIAVIILAFDIYCIFVIKAYSQEQLNVTPTDNAVQNNQMANIQNVSQLPYPSYQPGVPQRYEMDGKAVAQNPVPLAYNKTGDIELGNQ